tara:strand:+ start:7225 stop:7353 length:129 start_codon:yes stop_codon:yes gene_type:complete
MVTARVLREVNNTETEKKRNNGFVFSFLKDFIKNGKRLGCKK